jgi:CBS domain-containing protein
MFGPGLAGRTINTNLVGSIAAVARSRLVTISADALLVEAAKRLSDTHISLLVVCDDEGAMVGVITKTDIVLQIGRCSGRACLARADMVMTDEVAYCRPSDYLPEVLSMMATRGFVHIPVIDDRSRPLGVVNARDALRALLAQEQYQASLLRDYVMGVGYR